MYGLGHPDLAFREMPLSTSVRPRVENTRLGRVEVSGGSLSSDQVITHLQWIVPDPSYQWDVQQVEENVFKVNFPSKNELVRVQHFGRFHVPHSTIILSFDFRKKEVSQFGLLKMFGYGFMVYHRWHSMIILLFGL
jgi:hypothetical protein